MGAPFPSGPPETPWDEQPTAAPRRSRARFVVGTLVTAALVLLTLALTRWLGLGPTLLDTRAVERDVARQFEEQHEVPIELDCPRGMEVASGAVYTCTGETGDGDEITLEVRIADSLDGAYTWLEV